MIKISDELNLHVPYILWIHHGVTDGGNGGNDKVAEELQSAG